MTRTGPAWPVPELVAIGVPEWLAIVFAIGGTVATLALVAFLVYAVWATLVYRPRVDKALDVLTRLDPAVYATFPERNAWGEKTGNLDVCYLASLHPLLKAEDTARRVDERLADARARVSRARSAAEVTS